MNLFLRAKHWQLFLLTFGIPMLLQMVMMFSIFSHLLRHPDAAAPDFQAVFSYFKLFPIIMLLFVGTLLGWQWSLAISLQKMIPDGIKMKVSKFKTFFFIPVVYISLILIFVFYILTFRFSNGDAIDFRFSSGETIDSGFYIFIPFLVIFPLHLFSIFCLFYCIYFVAKTLKTVELQREVVFNDFIGEFFLTWFFPVGVWILQPRINKIIKEHCDKGEITAQD